MNFLIIETVLLILIVEIKADLGPWDPAISDGDCSYFPKPLPNKGVTYLAKAILKGPHYEVLTTKQFHRLQYWSVRGENAKTEADLDSLQPVIYMANRKSLKNWGNLQVTFFGSQDEFYILQCLPSVNKKIFKNLLNITCRYRGGSPDSTRMKTIGHSRISILWRDGSNAFLIWSCILGQQQIHVVSRDKTISPRQLKEILPIIDNLGFDERNFVFVNYDRDYDYDNADYNLV